MNSKTSQPDGSRQQDNSSDSRTAEQKKLDHLAGEAAEQAQKTEERYDQDHDIFTK
jgi:hypothetical protein